MVKIGKRYFYIVRFKWITDDGPHCRWCKICDTPTGVSIYEPVVIDGKLSWEYDKTIKGKTVDDYNHNLFTLDYNPGIHDKMIMKENY